MPVLNFKCKGTVYSHHLGLPFRPLVIDEKKSLPKTSKKEKKQIFELDDNLIIQGDNLHALKALLSRYAGKVNGIYIDPPYNTGNEGWKYNDNANSPVIQEWLKQNGIGIDDLERHDKWLCMMWPRLQLLKELLAENGVIFISIDDNEQHHLRVLMDEIFGEQNFVSTIIWRKKAGGGQDSKYFAGEHDYILCYRKSDTYHMNFRKTEVQESLFNKNKNGRKCRFIKLEKWGSNAYREDRPTMFYPIKDPDGKDFYPKAPDGKDGNWRTSPLNLKKQNIHWEKRKDQWTPFEVKYLDELNGKSKIIKDRTIFYDLATTTDATNEQKKIFGKKVFSNSKPVDLLIRLFKIGVDKDAIILDSFAGSGTTAQAVLELNKADGGRRKFILVECENYANKITAERVRRVIKGVPQSKNELLKKGLGGSFTYCTMGKEMSEENLIKGNSLPSYKALSNHVYYVATGQTLNKVQENKDFYIGKTKKDTAFFVIYKKDIKFLRSKECALNLERKEKIQNLMRQKKCPKAVVFAPVHYFDSSEELAKEGIIFCQLPFAIYEVTGV